MITDGILINNLNHMNNNSKIEELKLFTQDYLKEYKKNFTKITKKASKYASIKSDYFD
jgi:hypothetical protein